MASPTVGLGNDRSALAMKARNSALLCSTFAAERGTNVRVDERKDLLEMAKGKVVEEDLCEEEGAPRSASNGLRSESTHLVLVAKGGKEGVLGQWGSPLAELKVCSLALHLKVVHLMPVIRGSAQSTRQLEPRDEPLTAAGRRDRMYHAPHD